MIAAMDAAAVLLQPSEFDIASNKIRDELSLYLGKFIDHMKALEKYHRALNKWKEASKAGKPGKRPKRPARPTLPPILLNSTTGLGKTHHAADMVAAAVKCGIPVLMVVRDHKLADEFESKLSKMKVALWRYFGRSAPLEEWKEKRPHPGPQWVCQKTGIIPIISAENHRPAIALCSNCEHGRARALDLAEMSGDQKKVKDCEQWFATQKIKPSGVSRCVWLDSLAQTLEQMVVIIPAQSFSEAMTEMVVPGTKRTIPRLVIIDEEITIGTELRAGIDQIIRWLKNIESARSTVMKLIDADDEGTLDEAFARMEGLDAASEVFRICSAEVGAAADQKASLSQTGVDKLRALHLLHGKSVMQSGTATWEKVKRFLGEDGEEAYSVPLRAASAILASARAGVVRIDAGAIISHEISAGIEYLKSCKNGGIWMDATASTTSKTIVERCGGEVIKIIAPQHIHIIRHPKYSFWRSSPKKIGKEAHIEYSKQRIVDAKTLIQMNFPGRPISEIGVFVHKIWLTSAPTAGTETWRWWGPDHVGTDAFKWMPLCIFGTQLPGEESLKKEYGIHRAALFQVGIETADWSGESRKMKIEETPGNPDSIFDVHMPADDTCRAWYLDKMLSQVVQAIGRARGASWPLDRKPLEVHIFGGLPLVGLEGYGLRVHEYRFEQLRLDQPDAAAAFVAEMNTQRHADAQQRAKDSLAVLDDAFDMLSGAGMRISVRSMQSAIDGMQVSVPQKALRDYLKALEEQGLVRTAGGPNKTIV